MEDHVEPAFQGMVKVVADYRSGFIAVAKDLTNCEVELANVIGRLKTRRKKFADLRMQLKMCLELLHQSKKPIEVRRFCEKCIALMSANPGFSDDDRVLTDEDLRKAKTASTALINKFDSNCGRGELLSHTIMLIQDIDSAWHDLMKFYFEMRMEYLD